MKQENVMSNEHYASLLNMFNGHSDWLTVWKAGTK